MAALGLAAIYVVMITMNAMTHTGPGVPAFAFAEQALKADAFDMLPVMRYKLFGVGLGVGARPTRYALICEKRGSAGGPRQAKQTMQ
jgi:hypothetical protein